MTVTKVDQFRGIDRLYLWETGEWEAFGRDEYSVSMSEALQNLTGSDQARHPLDWGVPLAAPLDNPNEPELPFCEND